MVTLSITSKFNHFLLLVMKIVIFMKNKKIKNNYGISRDKTLINFLERNWNRIYKWNEVGISKGHGYCYQILKVQINSQSSHIKLEIKNRNF